MYPFAGFPQMPLLRRSVLLLLLSAPMIEGRAIGPHSLPPVGVAQHRPSVAQQKLGGILQQMHYFASIGLSGAISCCITHSSVLPLEVIKTKMQTAGPLSPGAAFGAVLRDAQGKGFMRISAFFNGLPPTAVGYFMQGGVKFGGFEFFKHQIVAHFREDVFQKWRIPFTLASAATAEIVASVFLTPLEVVKLRVQTNPAAAARGMLGTFTDIMRKEGFSKFYVGLKPLMMRQLPLTVTKLVVYDQLSRVCTSYAADHEWFRPWATATAGVLAGAAAAVMSNPGDLLLTRICGSPTASINTNVAECLILDGFRDMLKHLGSIGFGMFAGLPPRVLQCSCLTGLQFYVYEGVKELLHVAAPLAQPLPVAVDE